MVTDTGITSAKPVAGFGALDCTRPLLMGILNITPDSFSDGGLYLDVQQAVERAVEMVRQGADIIDVGGESTRPGAVAVAAEEQLERVVPVLTALRQRLPAATRISIDTRSARVAAAALDAGADIINDVASGGDDPGILPLAAASGASLVLMHMQGRPETMQVDPYYEQVVEEVLAFLLHRVEQAKAAGVREDRIILDPGIGFGKRSADNLALLAALGRFTATGFPVLLGTSRKRFMGSICKVTDPRELRHATAATTALGVMAGVCVFRVHDIPENRQAADVAYAIRACRQNTPPR
jgi:dihydropteroate synthase